MVAIGIFCHNSSKFDKYSDFKPRCSSCRRMALSYTCFKQERNIKDTTETSTVTTETTTETPSVTTETPADTPETIIKIISNNPKVTAKEIATVCGITEDGVAYHIKKLKQRGRLIRIGGSRNGGEWKVVE